MKHSAKLALAIIPLAALTYYLTPSGAPLSKSSSKSLAQTPVIYTYTNTTVTIRIARTNLLDEYLLLWSPYSSCCYYPVDGIDYIESGTDYFLWQHDLRVPQPFGYWKVELK